MNPEFSIVRKAHYTPCSHLQHQRERETRFSTTASSMPGLKSYLSASLLEANEALKIVSALYTFEKENYVILSDGDVAIF